jgi:hypothetical protein
MVVVGAREMLAHRCLRTETAAMQRQPSCLLPSRPQCHESPQEDERGQQPSCVAIAARSYNTWHKPRLQQRSSPNTPGQAMTSCSYEHIHNCPFGDAGLCVAHVMRGGGIISGRIDGRRRRWRPTAHGHSRPGFSNVGGGGGFCVCVVPFRRRGRQCIGNHRCVYVCACARKEPSYSVLNQIANKVPPQKRSSSRSRDPLTLALLYPERRAPPARRRLGRVYIYACLISWSSQPPSLRHLTMNGTGTDKPVDRSSPPSENSGDGARTWTMTCVCGAIIVGVPADACTRARRDGMKY